MRSSKLLGKRVLQTFQFANSGQILTDLALSRSPWRHDELTFKTQSGLTMAAPNFPGARVPLYEVFIEDSYELEDLTAGLRPDATVLDIGGHIGSFSVAIAATLPGATVHAYEASPVTYRWLERNVRENGLQDRVHAHHAAVSDHAGELTFADNAHGSGLNGLTAPSSAQQVSVPAITFDEVVERAGGQVDVVKIDTEGAEYSIVLPSSPASWSSVQRVVLEYHPVPGHSWQELQAFLASAGLRVTRHEPSDTPGLGLAWLTR